MPGVWLSVGHVRVQESLHEHHAQDWIVIVLDVAAKFVLVSWEELGVAHGWEVKHLSTDASDTIVSSLER